MDSTAAAARDHAAAFGVDGFESVLRAAADGADWAWAKLVDRYSGPLLGYLRARSRGDPEDALSDTWISAAAAIGSFSGDEAAFRSWLFVIAHRRAVDGARRHARRPAIADGAVPDGAGTPVRSAEAEALEHLSTERALRLLRGLTPLQRDVVALRVIAGLSLEETARVVGRRIGAVKALQKRGLATLRRTLESDRIPAP